MTIIRWLLSLFGILKRIKVHAKAELDVALGRDSTPLLATDSDKLLVHDSDREAPPDTPRTQRLKGIVDRRKERRRKKR